MSYLDSYMRPARMDAAKYASLASRKQVEQQLSERKRYEGLYHGERVTFDRVFRDRELTDMECQCLCDGLQVTLQGLSRMSMGRTIRYGVRVHLEHSVVKGVSGTFVSTVVRAGKALPYDPSYVFSIDLCKQENQDENAVKPSLERVTSDVVSGADVGQLVDEFSDEEDARMAAMIAAPELPLVQKVKTKDGTMPLFVPVLFCDDKDTVVPNGQEPVRVEHDTGQSADTVSTVYGTLKELSDRDMAMENELAMLEEAGSIEIAEDLELDPEDTYEDNEGYEELPWDSGRDPIDDDSPFE